MRIIFLLPEVTMVMSTGHMWKGTLSAEVHLESETTRIISWQARRKAPVTHWPAGDSQSLEKLTEAEKAKALAPWVPTL